MAYDPNLDPAYAMMAEDVPSMEEIQKAKSRQSMLNLMSGLGQAGATIGAGIAGARVAPDTSNFYAELAKSGPDPDELARKRQERQLAMLKYAQTRGDSLAEQSFQNQRMKQDLDFKRKEMKLREEEFDLKKNEKLLAQTGDVQAKFGKMSAEQVKQTNSEIMAMKAAKDMDSALKAGHNTFSPVGDNPFTIAAREWAEGLGRLQSGGAINAEEEKRFREMAPTVWDSTKIQREKLRRMQEMMAQRLKSRGFQDEQVAELTPIAPPIGSGFMEEAIAGPGDAQGTDPYLQEFARSNGLSYQAAKNIAIKRGYKPTEK